MEIGLQEIKQKLNVCLYETEFIPFHDKNELLSIKNRFEANAVSILEDAKRKHESFGSFGMPWWGWILIAYTGYDDIFRIFTSYLAIPLIILIVVLYSLKDSPIFAPVNQVLYVAKDIISSQLKKKMS